MKVRRRAGQAVGKLPRVYTTRLPGVALIWLAINARRYPAYPAWRA